MSTKDGLDGIETTRIRGQDRIQNRPIDGDTKFGIALVVEATSSVGSMATSSSKDLSLMVDRIVLIESESHKVSSLQSILQVKDTVSWMAGPATRRSLRKP